MYDLPDEIGVVADGPLRIITLNRPDALNAVNDPLHTGLARLWPRLSEDRDARAAVLTGSGRAFSAGGDFEYLAELSRDAELRAKTIAHGRDLVLGMARCRVPIVAAVNGPAVGLGCSLVALSDIVYMADTAYLADPHVQIGLVAADGGPLTWPLHTSLLLAKEYALTGARIPAARAAAIGLANHVVADPLTEAVACAKRIATLPRQAVESTKRVLNLQLERAVLATLDFAMAAEEQSFATDDFRAILAKLTEGKTS
jgi:enoyl-CoA hydratase